MRRIDFLTKSFKSAVVMATILVSAISLAFLAAECVVHDLANTPITPGEVIAIAVLVPLLFAFLIILPAAIMIYRLDASYFGRRAIFRWLVMGVLLGLGLFAITLILPHRQPGDSAMLSAVRTVARGVLSGGAAYVAHWLAFKAPFWTNQNRRLDGGGDLPVETEMEHQE